jgi:hypothetical protein
MAQDKEERQSGKYTSLLEEMLEDKETSTYDKLIVLEEILTRSNLRDQLIQRRLLRLKHDLDLDVNRPAIEEDNKASNRYAKDLDDLLRLTARFIQINDNNRPSDDDLSLRVHHIFYNSTAFKAAAALALLGAVLIGMVSISSSWINFTAANTVAKTQADLAKTREDVVKTEKDAQELQEKYSIDKDRIDKIIKDDEEKLNNALNDATKTYNKLVDTQIDVVKNGADEYTKTSNSAIEAAKKAGDSITGTVNRIVEQDRTELEERIKQIEDQTVSDFAQAAGQMKEIQLNQKLKDKLDKIINKVTDTTPAKPVESDNPAPSEQPNVPLWRKIWSKVHLQ